jgi:cysteine desulfurase / selenocysteine lyase
VIRDGEQTRQTDRMIYFDHAATAGSRPTAVVAAMMAALQEASANPGRSGHRLSLRSARLVEDARSELAALLGVSDSAHIVFTKNGTEALNLVLLGFLRQGDRVLAGSFEHNAVVRPLRGLERDRGIRLEWIPALDSASSASAPLSKSSPKSSPTVYAGPVDFNLLEARLREEPVRLVAMTAASNVTGEIFPVAKIAALCRNYGASLLVDAAQAAGVADLQVERDGIDFLAVTGHKSLLGPPGTGALYIRDAGSVGPLLRGGTGSRSESEEQPDFLPDRFEAGTLNVPGLAGLAAGIRHLRSVGLESIRRRHGELFAFLSDRLMSVPGLVLVPPSRALQDRLQSLHDGPVSSPGPAERLAIVSFNIDRPEGMGWIDPARIARRLDDQGILCRPGLHCASRAHRTLGTFPIGTVRFSLSPENSEAEIEEAVAALHAILREES